MTSHENKELIDVFLIVIRIDFPLFFLLPCKLLYVCLRNEFLIKTFIMIMIMIMIMIIILSAIAPWIHSYSDNVMTKLMHSATGQTHEKLTSIRYIYHLKKKCLEIFTEAFVRNETFS